MKSGDERVYCADESLMQCYRSCQHMIFGEIQGWYGWTEEPWPEVSEVRMGERNSHIIKGLSCHVVGCAHTYPMENFFNF